MHVENLCYFRVSTPAGKAGKGAFFRIWLEKLENHRFFSCFGWKSWNLFLGLVISNSIVPWDRPFPTTLTQDWKFSCVLFWVVGRPLLSGAGLREDIEFI